jgi:hypothetical protein
MRSPGVTGMRRAENNWAKSAISEESFAMRVNGTLYSDPSLVRASICACRACAVCAHRWLHACSGTVECS